MWCANSGARSMAEFRGDSVGFTPGFHEATRRFVGRSHADGTMVSWLAEADDAPVGLVSVVVHEVPPRPDDVRTCEGLVVNMFVRHRPSPAGDRSPAPRGLLRGARGLGLRRLNLMPPLTGDRCTPTGDSSPGTTGWSSTSCPIDRASPADTPPGRGGAGVQSIAFRPRQGPAEETVVDAGEPISYLALENGTPVVSATGTEFGTVGARPADSPARRVRRDRGRNQARPPFRRPGRRSAEITTSSVRCAPDRRAGGRAAGAGRSPGPPPGRGVRRGVLPQRPVRPTLPATPLEGTRVGRIPAGRPKGRGRFRRPHSSTR